MKYLLGLTLFLILAADSQAQKELTAPRVKYLLQGHWVSDDSNFAITVIGDTIYEFKGRNGRAESYDYTISKESCDPDLGKKMKGQEFTGFYIDESGTYSGIELCNALITITDDTLILLYFDGRYDLKKKPLSTSSQ